MPRDEICLVRSAVRLRLPVAILLFSIFSSPGFCQIGGPFVPPVNLTGTSAKLPGVKGMAVDASGDVFFSSGGDNPNSVLRWDASTGALSTFAGNGSPGYGGDNGPATSAQLNGVTGVAVDGAGNVFIEVYTPPILVLGPTLFSLSRDGKGQGAIWHAATGQIASSQNPAVAGEVLSMYTTSLIPGGVIPPRVIIGGKLADIQYLGDAPGYPGYNQVNVRVPEGVVPGSAVSCA